MSGTRWSLMAGGVAPVCCVVALTGCGTADSVSPGRHDVFLRVSEHDTLVVRVDLAKAPPSREPLDVLFLFDTTSSMGNVIDTMRNSAESIMNAVRELSVNSAFGVASFADYPPHGEPWGLHQDLTLDLEAAVRGVRQLRLSDGGDLPEAYARGLHESRFVGWRPGARRFVVLFGDAPARDPDFYGRNYGIDPGPDGVPNTADDLRLRDVVRGLRQDRIAVISVYDSTRGPANKSALDDAVRGFQFMATETGGLVRPVTSARDVPDAIKGGLREGFRPVPAIEVPEDFRLWVAIGPPRKTSDTFREYEFYVELRPPKGTPEGTYRFPLRVVHGRGGWEPRETLSTGEIGETRVIVRMGWMHFPWRRWLLPLYLLLLALFLARRLWRRGPRPAIRYQWNGQYWLVARRLVVLGVVAAGAYLVWKGASD